jgi:hypothetical protein
VDRTNVATRWSRAGALGDLHPRMEIIGSLLV